MAGTTVGFHFDALTAAGGREDECVLVHRLREGEESAYEALIFRYGPRGTFWSGRAHRSSIRLWEIWNEPNERSLWPVQPFYRSYASLLRDAYKAVKSADRHATVVLPGFPNFS